MVNVAYLWVKASVLSFENNDLALFSVAFTHLVRNRRYVLFIKPPYISSEYRGKASGYLQFANWLW